MKSADGIGWGYYDDLCHFYFEAFEQNISTQNKRIHSDVSSAGAQLTPVIRGEPRGKNQSQAQLDWHILMKHDGEKLFFDSLS